MKKELIASAVSGALFVILLVLVRTFDVAAVGPAGTEIGLSGMNAAVHEALGVNYFWYDLTEVFGFMALGICALFGLMGLMQLVSRRSLLKVDRRILVLGAFYAVVIVCYVLFELVVVNYRPVIMLGETLPEASFPSSHTMLICCVMGSTVLMLKHYVKSFELRVGLQAGCLVVAAVTVVGRLLSGVHWMTDIVGGVLLSCALVALFAAMVKLAERLQPRE